MQELLNFLGREQSFYYLSFIATVLLVNAAAWYVSIDNTQVSSNLLHERWMRWYFAISFVAVSCNLHPMLRAHLWIGWFQLASYIVCTGLLLQACVVWLRSLFGVSLLVGASGVVVLSSLVASSLLYMMALLSVAAYGLLFVVMTTAFLRNRNIGYLFLLLACLSVVLGATYQAMFVYQGHQNVALELYSAYTICGLCMVCIGYILVVQYREQRVLERLALHDPLTSLLNRRGMDEAFAGAADKSLQPWCVAAIDIDFFKKINDHYGHDVGDIVLKGVADVLRKQVRSQDILCRYGGEEFMFILQNTALSSGEAIAQRIRNEVANAHFHGDAAQIRVTVSIGLALGDEHADLQGQIKAADKALYQAKAQGRNCVVVAA